VEETGKKREMKSEGECTSRENVGLGGWGKLPQLAKLWGKGSVIPMAHTQKIMRESTKIMSMKGKYS